MSIVNSIVTTVPLLFVTRAAMIAAPRSSLGGFDLRNHILFKPHPGASVQMLEYLEIALTQMSERTAELAKHCSAENKARDT